MFKSNNVAITWPDPPTGAKCPQQQRGNIVKRIISNDPSVTLTRDLHYAVLTCSLLHLHCLFALLNLHCKICIVWFAMLNLNISSCFAHFALRNLHCSICTAQFASLDLRCSTLIAHFVLLDLHRFDLRVHPVQYMFFKQWTPEGAIDNCINLSPKGDPLVRVVPILVLFVHNFRCSKAITWQ